MAIIQALVELGPEWEGAAYRLKLITDNKNLKCDMTNTMLNRR